MTAIGRPTTFNTMMARPAYIIPGTVQSIISYNIAYLVSHVLHATQQRVDSRPGLAKCDNIDIERLLAVHEVPGTRYGRVQVPRLTE